MKRITNYLRGVVRVRVSGVDLERFLNLCAKERLAVWDADREETFTLYLTVTRRDFAKLKSLAEKAQCSLEGAARRGLPFFLARFRGRWALGAGLLLFCLALLLGSRTLMVIDVQGNEQVTTAEILSVLRQHGVHPGIYTPSVERGILANDILLQMDALSFFAINFHGIRAEVIVREKTPPPEIVDEKLLTDLVACATGIITQMEVLAGQSLVTVGQTVCKGEMLVSGLIDIPEPEYAQTDLGVRRVHAQGRIYARTWHTLKAEIPLDAEVKLPTGSKKSRYALVLLGKRFHFYENSGIFFEKYDKITESRALTLPDGSELPLRLEKETYRAYQTAQAALAEDRAEEMLREQLLADLQKLLTEPEDEIVTTDFVTRKAGGFLEVTLLAECKQQIARERPRAPLQDGAYDAKESGQ